MSYPYGLEFFKTFLSKEFSAENIEFWVDVNYFKTLTENEMITKRAKKIYEKYFKTGAEKVVRHISGVS